MGPQFVDHLLFFFFNDTATTEIYTLSLHDALPIARADGRPVAEVDGADAPVRGPGDRKSTRLNSSHTVISYAVFCLKKKKQLRRGRALHSLCGAHRIRSRAVVRFAFLCCHLSPLSRFFFFLMIRRPPRSTLFP